MGLISTMIILPKRYKKYGVGKFMGGSVYIHRMYDEVLSDNGFYVEVSKQFHMYYNVIKQNIKTGSFTFIHSPDFDYSHEPLITYAILVEPSEYRANGPMVRTGKYRINGFTEKIISLPKHNAKIYHHKWLFVKNDYPGFNVQESIKRSLTWMGLDGINKSRIGNLKYWELEVVPMIDNCLKTS